VREAALREFGNKIDTPSLPQTTHNQCKGRTERWREGDPKIADELAEIAITQKPFQKRRRGEGADSLFRQGRGNEQVSVSVFLGLLLPSSASPYALAGCLT